MDEASESTMTVGRRWVFRAILLLSPFLLLFLLEVGLRVGGVGEDLIWDNPYVRFAEGHRFFPEWEDEVEMPKPAGLFRIVALGGSATMGAGVKRAFPDLLEEKLRRARPNRRFEVINGGFLAMGSHRVYEVEREAARFDPDLFLIYLGHNEFLEDVAVDPVELAAGQQGLMQTARRLRVVTWLGRLIGTRTEGTGDILATTFLEAPEFPLIRSKEQVEARLAFLAHNVGQMIDFARSRGIEALIVPAVANPLYPPGNSEHGPGYEQDPQGWDLLMRQALAAYREGRHEDAVSLLTEQHGIDDRFAASRYLLGLSLLALDRTDLAKDELRQANSLDRRGARSSPEIRATIMAICREHGAPAVDLRDQFEAGLVQEYRLLSTGKRPLLFLDHCHPTEGGHELIARDLVGRIVKSLPAKYPR
jgi:lysophospholipase L1-like esterase